MWPNEAATTRKIKVIEAAITWYCLLKMKPDTAICAGWFQTVGFRDFITARALTTTCWQSTARD